MVTREEHITPIVKLNSMLNSSFCDYSDAYILFNPNKVGFFEGKFFCGAVYLSPPIPPPPPPPTASFYKTN